MKTSDKIEYDKNLGVHKTYKGFKWQPSSGYIYYIAPRKRNFDFIQVKNIQEFFKLIDNGKLK